MDTVTDPLGWLAAGVPLTLLLDLATAGAMDSAAIYADERGDASWLRPAVPAA